MTAARGQVVTWRGGKERGVSAVVDSEVHDAFEAIARQRGVTKATLARFLIEAAVNDPAMAESLINYRKGRLP